MLLVCKEKRGARQLYLNLYDLQQEGSLEPLRTFQIARAGFKSVRANENLVVVAKGDCNHIASLKVFKTADLAHLEDLEMPPGCLEFLPVPGDTWDILVQSSHQNKTLLHIGFCPTLKKRILQLKKSFPDFQGADCYSAGLWDLSLFRSRDIIAFHKYDCRIRHSVEVWHFGRQSCLRVSVRLNQRARMITSFSQDGQNLLISAVQEDSTKVSDQFFKSI